MNDFELKLLLEQSRLLIEDSREFLDNVWARERNFRRHLEEMRACIAATKVNAKPMDTDSGLNPPPRARHTE